MKFVVVLARGSEFAQWLSARKTRANGKDVMCGESLAFLKKTFAGIGGLAGRSRSLLPIHDLPISDSGEPHLSVFVFALCFAIILISVD